MDNIFSDDFLRGACERTGAELAKKDLAEERHNLKKTDEEIFDDFQHDIHHPFFFPLYQQACAMASRGEKFVMSEVIAIMKHEDEEAEYLYVSGGKGSMWRSSGNALVSKYLKDMLPDLDVPMKIGCKGEKLMIEAYPTRFQWLKDMYAKRGKL